MVKSTRALISCLGAVEAADSVNLLQGKTSLSFAASAPDGLISIEASTAASHSRSEAVLAQLKKSVDERLAAGGSPVETGLAGEVAELLSQVETQFLTEGQDQQKQADALNNPIKACNDAMKASFEAKDTGVNHLKAVAEKHISTHNECRPVQKRKCEDFRKEAKEFKRSAPSCSSDYSSESEVPSDEDAKLAEECLLANANWVSDHRSDVELASAACSAKKSDCNTEQRNGEVAFCEYKKVLENACDSLSICLAPEGSATLVEQRKNQKESIQTMFNGLQEAYKVVQLAKCFLELLQKDTIEQSGVDACNNKEVVFPSELTVGFVDFTAPVSCDTSPALPAPGDATWSAEKYVPVDGENWEDLLQSVAACPAATTTAEEP